MKNVFLFILTYFISLNLYAQVNYSWANGIGGNLADDARAVLKDAGGNVYVGGSFQGTVDFDPSPAAFIVTSAGSDDGYIAKYDASGNFLAVFTYTNNLSCKILGMAIDANDDILATGAYSGQVDFDPGTGTDLLSAGASGTNIFILKLNANGTHGWARNIGKTAVDDYGNAITTDAANNVIVTGYFQSTGVDFDPGVGISTLSAVGNKETFVLKLNSAGLFTWAFSLAGNSHESGNSITVDALNNIFIGGYFMGYITLDPLGSTSSQVVCGALSDSYVAKYSSSGTYIWGKSYSGNFSASVSGTCSSVQVDNSGNVYTLGSFKGVVDFDPAVPVYSISSASSTKEDMYICKLNNNGNLVWAKSIGGTGFDYGINFNLNNTSSLYVTGSFEGNVDFDPSASTNNLVSNGLADIYVANYDLNGNYISAFNVGGTGNDFGQSIIAFTTGVYCAGNYSSSCDFDPSVTTNTISSNGGIDMFLAKYSYPTTQISKKELNSHLSIYPNPSNGLVTLTTEETGVYKIINALGELVTEIKVSEGPTQLNLSHLSSGIYYLCYKHYSKIIIINN
ncbi:MAG: T9SS type A sorting domain-containing protein [Bacteroidia bacterium]|nr:T9SS type A sorting domain-containing protein [Bacteroidia bacterium]